MEEGEDPKINQINSQSSLKSRTNSIRSVSSAPSPCQGRRKIGKSKKTVKKRNKQSSRQSNVNTIRESEIDDEEQNETDDRFRGNICVFLRFVMQHSDDPYPINTLESLDTDHCASKIYQKFLDNLEKEPGWCPVKIFHLFQYKNHKLWRAKQFEKPRIVNPGQFHENPYFSQNLRNGSQFLVCIETKSLIPMNGEDQQLLDEFYDQFQFPYIWTVARSLDDSRKKEVSIHEFEIQNLVIGCDKWAKLHVKCPMNDIIMAVIPHEEPTVIIVINSDYLNASKTKKGWVVRPMLNYKCFFKKRSPSIENRSKKSTRGLSNLLCLSDSDDNDPDIYPSQSCQSQNAESQTQSEKAGVNSDSGESIEMGNQTSKSKYQKVIFSAKSITIQTETNTERYKISHVLDEPKATSHQNWCGKTPDERVDQYQALFEAPFDLFDIVRSKKAYNLVFIPYDELVSNELKTKVVAHWKEKTKQPMPDSFAYIIFDKNKSVPYTGKLKFG